jgi:hypothetical protein
MENDYSELTPPESTPEQHKCHWHWETRGRSCCQCNRFVPGHESDTIIECDHIEDGFDYTDEGLIYTRFPYCPMCGEKL